jgi:hypothetical protein
VQQICILIPGVYQEVKSHVLGGKYVEIERKDMGLYSGGQNKLFSTHNIILANLHLNKTNLLTLVLKL